MGRKDQIMVDFYVHPEHGPLNRYLCLGCGRTWRFEEYRLVPGEHICPHCGDMYWVDNVVPDVPSNLFNEWHFHPECNHDFVSDTPGDVQYCTICRADVSVDGAVTDWTLRNFQEKRLKELGL